MGGKRVPREKRRIGGRMGERGERKGEGKRKNKIGRQRWGAHIIGGIDVCFCLQQPLNNIEVTILCCQDEGRIAVLR